MTPQEINRKIAEWLGLNTVHNGRTYCNPMPDFYNTNAAFDLLDVLVERGYHVYLTYSFTKRQWATTICCADIATRNYPQFKSINKSKLATICEAAIQLIEKGE